ncbi:glycosyltransferase family 2 protein [Olivibacter sp. SDN3]|uniref:glycosyltransferase family 2 protein n=1 Tax=Olivibacter sp. SDN3 TaxID=2764720 RepID=UPI001651AFEC|nr:glycosyltransferase family A protein [Olivibacter sp. SDN3]QNL52043.1 glycosyltransferase family 2 protein [Olivibacter sp. SDN3]
MISVIIPCYNSESFLRRAIDSVHSQSYTDWEIILVNNNSVDGTQNVIDEYVLAFPGRIFSLFEDRKGACYARNLGLSAAKGEWIQFLDADDELLPGKFERQLGKYAAKADVIIGAFSRVEVGTDKKSFYKVHPNKSIWYSILYSQAGITSSNLYKREAVLKINGWNTTLGSSQEYDMMFRLVQSNAAVAFDTTCAALIYEVPNSISRPTSKKALDKIERNYIDLRLRVAAHLNESGGWTNYLHRIYSVRLFRMMVGRREASLEHVKTIMRDLQLKVPPYIEILLICKYYIKRVLIRFNIINASLAEG